MEKKSFLPVYVAASLIVLDQLFKTIVTGLMDIGQSFSIIPGILRLTYIRNTGAGFGILQGQRWLLIWAAVIVVGLILYFWDKIPEKRYVQWGVGLILGGTIGNLIDRTLHGAVIDFVDFGVWPAFNAADSGLTIGAILLAIYFIKNEKK